MHILRPIADGAAAGATSTGFADSNKTACNASDEDTSLSLAACGTMTRSANLASWPMISDSSPVTTAKLAVGELASACPSVTARPCWASSLVTRSRREFARSLFVPTCSTARCPAHVRAVNAATEQTASAVLVACSGSRILRIDTPRGVSADMLKQVPPLRRHIGQKVAGRLLGVCTGTPYQPGNSIVVKVHPGSAAVAQGVELAGAPLNDGEAVSIRYQQIMLLFRDDLQHLWPPRQ